MALLACPDCRNAVSSEAPACPHCGRPMATARAAPPQVVAKEGCFLQTLNLGCGIVLLIIAIGFVGCIIADTRRSSSAASSQPARPAAATPNQAHNQLLAMDDITRGVALGHAVRSIGKACPSTSAPFHQGMDTQHRALWNITCSTGTRYLVRLSPDAAGTTAVLDCNTLASIAGAECYKQH